MGPVLIFDKSAIHSFAEREAYWLENLYCINRVPPLFMEIMADLKKKPSNLELSAEDVKRLANKFPVLGVYQNAHHIECWRGDLLGYKVPMTGQVITSNGNEVIDERGERGLFVDYSPEDKAMDRWKRGKFNEFENVLAERWREALKGIDLTAPNRAYSKLRRKGQKRISNLEELAAIVRDLCEGKAGQYILLKNVILSLEPEDDKFFNEVVKNWKVRGRPPVRLYAPYATYCFAVNTFFAVGLAYDLISTRASNVIDLQYLFYLPFCHAFTSGDKFHRQLAPFFMRRDQVFVDSVKLKEDLRVIADSWSENEDKSMGTRSFITRPRSGMISEAVWDHCFAKHDWRRDDTGPKIELTELEKAERYEKLRPMMDAIKKHEKSRKGKPLNDWDAALNPDPEDHR